MYRVIYQFGTTEVASVRLHDTHAEAQDEAWSEEAAGENADAVWIEEVSS